MAAMTGSGATNGGQTSGTGEALRVLDQGTLGTILLGLVALGLIGYVLWRFVQAFVDPENVSDEDWGTGVQADLARHRLISRSTLTGRPFSPASYDTMRAPLDGRPKFSRGSDVAGLSGFGLRRNSACHWSSSFITHEAGRLATRPVRIQ